MTYSKYRVIFVGPTGGGKTSTIKTILRTANPSRANATEEMPQGTYQVHTQTVLKKEMIMVDTPGLNLESEIQLHGAFNAITPGPHVLVIVFSVRTPHNVMRKTCERYQARLGESVMKHTVIVFTGVDLLESLASGTTFTDYIANLPSDIKQLVSSQFVAFNNIANAPLINVLQVKELMSKFEVICTLNFGLYFKVQSTSLPSTPSDVFHKNSEALEKNISTDKSIQNGSNAEQHIDTHVIIQNGEADNDRLDLSQDPRSLQPHEDVKLESMPHSDTVSRASEDASMISSQDKESQGCSCFGNIARKFRPTPKEPEFTQFP